MDRERKPDLSGHVNGLDINIFRRDSGVDVSIEQEGVEVVLFRYSPQGVKGQQETPSLPAVAASSAILPASPAPALEAPAQPEVNTPVKIVGVVETIEGMGTTPQTGDAIFRFSVRWQNPKINTEEVSQVAAFREIAQTLNGFYTSPDPAIKLQQGRQISMMAWDHTARTGSYYPSAVNYLNFPTITNPKIQKRR